MTIAADNSPQFSPAGQAASGEGAASGADHLLPEAFVSDLASSACKLLGADLSLHAAGTEKTAYGEFLHSFEQTACCWLLSSPAGLIWMVLSAEISRQIADRLLGIRRASGPGPESLTTIERHVLRRLVDTVAEAMGRWLGQELTATEPESAKLDPGETVLVATFDMTLADAEGRMRICLPAGLAEAPPPPSPEADGRSERTELPAPTGGPVELSVIAAETAIPSAELDALGAGDVLITDADAGKHLVVRLNGVDAFMGQLGARNGKRAVTIIRPLGENE